MRARYEEGNLIPLPEEEWKHKLEKVRDELFKDCKERGGMISGEHGIGIVKKAYLAYVLNDEEISYMKKIKELFDPNNVMNPGKIFD
jgi:glycolate oxidase